MKHTTSITLLLLVSAACAFAQQPAQPLAAAPEKPIQEAAIARPKSAPAATAPEPTVEEQLAIAKLTSQLYKLDGVMKKAVQDYQTARTQGEKLSSELRPRMEAAQKSCKTGEFYDPDALHCTAAKALQEGQ